MEGITCMRDARRVQLAHTIVHHSCSLKPGDTILIEAFDLADGLVHEIMEEAYAAGGVPIVYLRRNSVIRQMLLHGSEEQLKKQAEIELFQMKQAQAYVGLRASDNVSEMSDVPAANMARYMKLVGSPV